MRVALLAQWLRVARSSPAHRTTALTYVAFVAVAQVGWVLAAIAHLALGPMLLAAAVLYLVELGGPVVAELRGAGTPWHPHHIAERYSLLTIIALGEGVIGTVAAVEPIIGQQGWASDAIMVVAGGTVLTFGLWWVYFSVPFGEILHAAGRSGWVSFVFGYGHIPLFAAIAAVGAGLHVAAYVVEGEAHVGFPVAVQAVAIPVGVFLVALFAIYALLVRRVDALHVALLAGPVAVLVLAVALSRGGLSFGASVAILAVAPAVVVVGYEMAGHRHAAEHVASLRARG